MKPGFVKAKEKHDSLNATKIAVFKSMIEDADIKDDEEFHFIVSRSINEYGLSTTEMAKYVEVSTSAASKWVHERTIPSMAVRRKALEWIKIELSKKIQNLDLEKARDRRQGSDIKFSAA